MQEELRCEPIGAAGNRPQGDLCKPPARPVVMIPRRGQHEFSAFRSGGNVIGAVSPQNAFYTLCTGGPCGRPLFAPAGNASPRRGGACPRPRAATRAAPTSGVPFPADYLVALVCRGGCPHPPGAGRWPGGAGRRGRRPLQRSTAAGTARQNAP